MHPRIAAAFFVPLALSLVLAAPVAAAPPTPTVYLAVGDSLAVGAGATDPDSGGYVALLSDYFAGASHGGAQTLVNVGNGGETTGSLLGAQLGSALAVIGDPGTDVRVVTLSIGGNDLQSLIDEPGDPCVFDSSSGACQAAVAGVLANASTNFAAVMYYLTTALAADTGSEKVLVMTLYNPFGGTGSPYEVPVDVALLGGDGVIDCGAAAGNPANAGMNDIIACTTWYFGGIVVDMYPVIGDHALALTHIGDPGFDAHLNDAGYEAAAKAHRRADRAS